MTFFILLDFFSFNSTTPVSVGLDALSLFFLLLTSVLGPIVVLCSTPLFYTKSDKLFFSFLLLIVIIQILLTFSFCVLDFFFFFLTFESILVPTYILICLFGINYKKLKASYYFIMYTLVTSVTFFVFIFLIFSEVGSTNLFVLKYHSFTDGRQVLLWFLLFVSLAGKVPTFPFYLWLPEAHVEAPTSGSVLLAGLILKLGCYGFLRFLLPLVKVSVFYYIPFIILLANLGILFSALSAIRTLDLKKIIAYSSVAHMNFSLLGLFSNTIFGMHGCSILLIGHGFVSSALFLLIGFLYDRYHTRLLYYYGGLSQVMPIFSIFFLFFNLANMSFPGSINFVGELLTLVGVVFVSKLSCFLFLFLSILSTTYSIWAFSRVCFGQVQGHLTYFVDMSAREFYLVIYLGVFSIVFGLIPNILLDSLYPYLLSLQYYT